MIIDTTYKPNSEAPVVISTGRRYFTLAVTHTHTHATIQTCICVASLETASWYLLPVVVIN